jgi:hypothetical protein
MPEIFDGSAQSRGDAGPQPETSEKKETSSMPKSPATADSANRRSRVKRHVDEYSDVMRAEIPTSNPLLAFIPKPENIFFDSQLPGESVLLVLRRHPITQLPWIILAILLFLAPILFAQVPFLAFLPPQFRVAAFIGWTLLILGFSLESFLTWFYNVYIITDERVIDVDFYSLLYKNVSSAKLNNIEDVTVTASGALSSIFNYGTIKIQTAAATTEFEFEDVPRPAQVAAFLNELMQEEELEEIEGRVT